MRFDHINSVHDPQKQHRLLTRRAVIAMVSVVVLTILIFVRLAILQINEHQSYSRLSDRNQLTMIPIYPKRGLIYDRHGVALANNIAVNQLEITPQRAKNLNETLRKLQTLIDIQPEELKQFYKRKRYSRPFEAIAIRRSLSDEDMAKIAENLHDLPGVAINAQLARNYPMSSAMAPVVGYMGSMDSQEREELNTGPYASSSYLGKTGIERQYETNLRGQVGYHLAEIDARGRVVQILKTIPSVGGDDLHLSIDHKLQNRAYEAMGKHQGAVVAIDPRNGEVLALVSTPSYDPNSFASTPDEASKKKCGSPQFNRAINGLYPIASTIKPFLALQGLEKGVITTSYTIRDRGWYKIPGHSHMYRGPSWRRGGYGWVNLRRSLIVSCDSYYYHLAYLLGHERITNILRQFGFGAKTNIDLPYESEGVVPTPKWKKTHKKKPWYPGDTVMIGIGQGLLKTTPLQLAHATATLAARGQRFRPHLLTKLSQTLKEDELYQAPDYFLEPVILNHSEAWQAVISAMRQVTKHPEGTGWRFGRDAPYSIAGKTGTGQVVSSRLYENVPYDQIPLRFRDHSLFIAFAPVTQPRISVAVIIENTPGAPAVVREIFDEFLDQKKKATTLGEVG